MTALCPECEASLTLTNVLSAYNEGDSGGGVLVADGTFTATNLTFGYDDAADGAAHPEWYPGGAVPLRSGQNQSG